MSSSADKAMKQRWTVAAATFAWIAAIVGPALTFDVSLTAAGDTGRMFTAFFQIVATCVFLLAVPRARKISTRTVWMLLAVAILALFALYCCSWLVLAFSIIGATSRRWSRA